FHRQDEVREKMTAERGTRLQKRRFLWAGLRMALALGIAFFICQVQLDFLEALFYDLRVRMRPVPKSSERISLILIDKHTQEELKRMPEALDYVKLFNGLKNGEPLKVLYTQDFLDIMGSFEELERLAEAGQRIPLVVVEDKKLPEPGLEEEFRLLPPL